MFNVANPNSQRTILINVVFSARLFDYFDSGVMEGLQHRLIKLSALRTNGLVAETPVDSMTLTSQVSSNYLFCQQNIYY